MELAVSKPVAIVNELNRIAHDVDSFNEMSADEIRSVAGEINEMTHTSRIAQELAEISEELKSIEKSAALINPGDKIVCLNVLQGVYPGRIYIAGEEVEPGYILVKEETSEKPIGIFKKERFCIFNNEF